ncbi:MAG: hypothetical protein EON96_00815, partial [Caulobacteraceae bacterium]
MFMFDVTGDDVARLSDSDLRTLVARLAIAELASQGAPVSAVTAGGHQDAPDGGLDVRVEAPGPLTAADFVPRASTGFQVKRPDMPASKIETEMRPDGVLRPVIGELADAGGAYVIVSAQGSVADVKLAQRNKAIRDSLAGHPTAADLKTDFYDRERLANWVNRYPGVAAWVRNRIGDGFSGWSPVGRWSGTATAADGGYMVSDAASVIDERGPEHTVLTVTAGIDAMRSSLMRPSRSVRLIGLSGLGKTRLVEALFEAGPGSAAPLDPALSIYTDYGNDLRPSAREMARRLVDDGQRAVLVVDNCNPETHSALAAICGEKGSQVSLLTIEYDIRDDEPERTDVFRLRATDDDLLESWLEREFPELQQLARRRIAEFSDGNFRIARALADTVDRSENLANLRNQDLFARIFHQRNAPDGVLLRRAETLALLYSYNGTETAEGSELAQLGALADASADAMFEASVELQQRGVVQSRGRWRAVLPHALANPLAAAAIARLSPARLDAFCEGLSDRMLRSFTRRIGFLHNSPEAKALLGRWLDPGGRLHPLADVSAFHLVQNLAPLDPEALLTAIEAELAGTDGARIVATSNPVRSNWVVLLRSLAFDPALFDRAVRAMLKFVAAEPEGHNQGAAAPQFAELFHFYLSGTRATLPQRVAMIRSLMGDTDPKIQTAGRLALEGMLKSRGFSSGFVFDFGARPRDFGWHPTTTEETGEWYREAAQIALDFDTPETRRLLAEQVRDLWDEEACRELLEAAADRYSAGSGWIDGWIAFRNARRYDASGMSEQVKARLDAVIEKLKPSLPLERARAYVLSRRGGMFDVADDVQQNPSAALQKAEEEAERIAVGFVDDLADLRVLVPEILAADFAPRAAGFGHGLAVATDDPEAIWDELVAFHAASPQPDRWPSLLAGFMRGVGERNRALADNLLERALTQNPLVKNLPFLQREVAVDPEGLDRIGRGLASGAVPTFALQAIATGITLEMQDKALRDLLLIAADRAGGDEQK